MWSAAVPSGWAGRPGRLSHPEDTLLRAVSLSRVLTLATALAVVTACGGGDGNGGTTTPTPTIAVALSGSTLSVTGGSTATTTVNLTRGGGFTGNVDLTAEGLPTGVTASFAPASLTGSTASSVLTLTAASTVTASTANVVVRAKGTGVTDATAPIALTVVAATPQSFTQALSPTTVSLAQGGTATTTLNFTRAGGFAGAIGIATSGAPAGLTVTPASTSVTGNSVALNVAATAAVAAGTYNVTITSTGTGVTTQTSTLPVTVTAAQPAGSYTIALSPTTVTLPATGTAGTGTATLNLTRTNFTDAVTVAVTGAPTGLTVTPASTSVTGTSVVLNIASTTGLAAGTYPVTITTSVAGQTNQTATLNITVPAAAAATVTAAVSPTTVSLPAGGGTGTSTLNLTRTNFTGTVNVAVSGAPTGLTVTPASTTTTGNSVALTVTSTAALAAGTYPVTITTSGTGIANATATLNVTVAAAVGGFSIAVPQTPITLTRGGTTTVNVDITRTGGFTGAVDIDVANLPAGVTATITSATTSVRFSRSPLVPRGPAFVAITGNRAVITLTASPTANVGPFTLTVTAAAAGFPTQTATGATVTVSNPTTGGNVAFTFCGTNATPIWFAYQDGTGNWTQATASNGTFSANITQSKGGIAYVQQTGTTASPTYQTVVYYGTPAELTSYGASQCPGSTVATGKTVNVSVAGLGTTTAPNSIYANINTAGASATITSPATTGVLANVPDGARDFLAAKVTQAIDVATFGVTATVNKLIIRRGLNPAGGSTLPVFDFGSSEAFDPVVRTLTLSGANAGDINSVVVGYTTSASSAQAATVPLYTDASASSSTTRTIYTVPAAQQRPGDLHVITAVSTPLQTSGTISQRGVIRFQAASANLTLTYGAALAAPTVSTLSAATPLRYRVQAPVQTQYAEMYEAVWSQPNRSVLVFETKGYSGGAAWDLSIPDLASAGYNATWGLQAGTTVGSSYVGTGYDFSITNGLVDGGTQYFATRTNTSGLSILSPNAPSVIPSFVRRALAARSQGVR